MSAGAGSERVRQHEDPSRRDAGAWLGGLASAPPKGVDATDVSQTMLITLSAQFAPCTGHLRSLGPAAAVAVRLVAPLDPPAAPLLRASGPFLRGEAAAREAGGSGPAVVALALDQGQPNTGGQLAEGVRFVVVVGERALAGAIDHRDQAQELRAGLRDGQVAFDPLDIAQGAVIGDSYVDRGTSGGSRIASVSGLKTNGLPTGWLQ